MKILLLTNNIKWKSLPKRIGKLELYLRERISFIHPEITIDRKDISTSLKIDSWNKNLDAVWYRNKYVTKNTEKYDAIGMVITKKDWIKAGGRKDRGGLYIINSDKTHSFYIICDEKSKAGRGVANGEYEFEEYLEHELLGHGLQRGFGYLSVNDTDEFIEGQDNTHYFFYKSTKDEYYKFVEKQYDTFVKQMKSKIRKVKDMIDQLGKKSSKNSVSEPLELVKRQSDIFIETANKIFGYNLRINEFIRDGDKQNKLYAQGRTTPGRIVTNAKAGQSLHQWGVAFDIVDRRLGYDLDWDRLGDLWLLITNYKGEHGGDWITFTDRPHFQNTLGNSLKSFQQGTVDYKIFK